MPGLGRFIVAEARSLSPRWYKFLHPLHLLHPLHNLKWFVEGFLDLLGTKFLLNLITKVK
jgi:hypothetical protein